MNQSLVLRNKKMLNSSVLIGIILIIAMVMSGKPTWFVALISSVFLGSTIMSFLVIKIFKNISPYIPAYLFIFSMYFVIWLILYIDPSLNKFLFLFAGILIPSFYQDRKISIYSAILAIGTTCCAFFMFGQEIYGGYDVVSMKSLYFTLAIVIIMMMLIYLQATTTENLRRMNEEKEKLILEEKYTTEAMLEKAKENEKNLLYFNSEFEKNTVEVNQITKDVVSSSEEINLSIEKQFHHIGEVSEGITKMKTEANFIADTSNNITIKTENSKELIKNSNLKINELLSSFNSLNKDFDENKSNVKSLYMGAAEIERLSKVIEGIAQQTTYLAINASIEATRAGEAGKGFSVVAERVGVLALDSNKAASEIKELSGKIQEITEMNEEFIERSNEKIERNSIITHEISQAFTEIKNTIEGISGVNEQITNLINLIDDVNTHMKGTEELSRGNAMELKVLGEGIRAINDTLEILENNVKLFNEKQNNKELTRK